MRLNPCPSSTHLLTLLLHLELQPHQAKASDSRFQGSSPRWIQTKSVLAQTITLEGLLGQMAFLEAVQDLEGTLAREHPHIKAHGAHLPPGTIQEIATASEANHLGILETSWKMEMKDLLDKVQASVRDCRTWVPEAI